MLVLWLRPAERSLRAVHGRKDRGNLLDRTREDRRGGTHDRPGRRHDHAVGRFGRHEQGGGPGMPGPLRHLPDHRQRRRSRRHDRPAVHPAVLRRMGRREPVRRAEGKAPGHPQVPAVPLRLQERLHRRDHRMPGNGQGRAGQRLPTESRLAADHQPAHQLLARHAPHLPRARQAGIHRFGRHVHDPHGAGPGRRLPARLHVRGTQRHPHRRRRATRRDHQQGRPGGRSDVRHGHQPGNRQAHLSRVLSVGHRRGNVLAHPRGHGHDVRRAARGRSHLP